MNKFKNIIMIVLGAISALFYALLQSKSRKLDRQDNEIKKIKQDNDNLKSTISGVEKDAKKWQQIKKNINSSSTDSIVDELRKRGEYDD